jgi:transcriptional regulator with XRE-family HTH domain
MSASEAVESRQGHPINPEVWEQPEMREALASREISSVYRLLRREGTSQRQIAAMTGQSQSEVSEILKGRQVMAYDVLTRISAGLGVPRGYMGLAYDEATAMTIGAADGLQATETEAMKRRKFLAHAAQITMGTAVFGPSATAWAASPSKTPAPNRIGLTDVRQIEAATRALRALDLRYGGGFCRDAVIAQLSWGQQLLESSAQEVVKDRLYVALADLHSLAGWTSFDIGLADSARGYYADALELAKQGKNHSLVADVLYRMGRVYLHDDAPNDALKMFQLGQIAAQESGSELAVSVLCANEAWAYAMMGNADQALKLLGRTKDEFARADVANAAAWVKFFDATDVSAMIGTVHTVLAQTVDPIHTKYAIPALSKAIAAYDDNLARSRAFNLSSLATNHLIAGDIDHGTRVGQQALESGAGLKSSRIKDRLRPMRTQAQRRSNNADARELVERVDSFFKA